MEHDEHDGDVTAPDLPSGLGSADDRTSPGLGTGDGTGEAFIAISAGADKSLDVIKSLVESCPPRGAPGRRRHLEVIANQCGDSGMFFFDWRRITLELLREEDE